MASTATEPTGVDVHPTSDGPLPEFVDWVLAVFVAIVGLGSIIGGSALAFVVDRPLLTDAIDRGDLVSPDLTDAELLDVSLAIATWSGVGLLVAGAAMVVVAVGYVVVRRRAHQRAAAGEQISSYGTNALLGAVVTTVLGFVPFSPALGGAVAGYIERGDSERTVSVGALSGLLAMGPLLVVLVFVLVGIATGFLGIQQTGLAAVVSAAMLLALLIVATVGAGVGALGGYLGGRLAENRATE